MEHLDASLKRLRAAQTELMFAFVEMDKSKVTGEHQPQLHETFQAVDIQLIALVDWLMKISSEAGSNAQVGRK